MIISLLSIYIALFYLRHKIQLSFAPVTLEAIALPFILLHPKAYKYLYKSIPIVPISIGVFSLTAAPFLSALFYRQ